MNKSELVKALADQANISLDEATLVVNTFVDSMKDSLLEGGRVEIRGFGSFKVKEYGSYAGRNPRTGEKVAVEPKRLPFFRAHNIHNVQCTAASADHTPSIRKRIERLYVF